MTKHNDSLTYLKVPVPPNLEEALGYDGKARYVAFYWEPAGDEAMFDDGRISTEADWRALLIYLRHPTTEPLFVLSCWECQGRGTTNQLENEPCPTCGGAGVLPFNIGNSEQEADYWLILDRQERKLYTAPVATACRFLQKQWPPLRPLPTEDQERIITTIAKNLQDLQDNLKPPSHEEILAAIQRQDELCNDLARWLDNAGEVLDQLTPVLGLDTTLELLQIDPMLTAGPSPRSTR